MTMAETPIGWEASHAVKIITKYEEKICRCHISERTRTKDRQGIFPSAPSLSLPAPALRHLLHYSFLVGASAHLW